jgi:histidine triad (HIT) family protein
MRMASKSLSHLALAAARWALRGRLGRMALGLAFNQMSVALPVEWLRQTENLLAFYHPQPAYPVHILIVPRRAIAGLDALGPADRELLYEIFQTAQSLAQELGLHERGYRLVVNGGLYQELPHLHFHLIGE